MREAAPFRAPDCALRRDQLSAGSNAGRERHWPISRPIVQAMVP